eukprot:TRINITY_DN7402_c0_g1_i2.p1 TRINITY_DN7402_c0_g1~~TRINITY_DN7402_c0_g1_i2.p1  ORF type:complete len:285 (+),score=51.34 TRINITY_DN7402_c0_g1_i2:40-855(+)
MKRFALPTFTDDPLDILSGPILLRIVRYLGFADLCRLSRCSKSFYFLSNNNRVWKNCFERIWDTENVSQNIWVNWKLMFKYCFQQERNKIVQHLRPRWTPDDERDHCLICNQSFTVSKRKHHCRNCGDIFCDNCTKKRSLLPQMGYDKKEVRVCDRCHTKLETVSTKKHSSTKLVVMGAMGSGKTSLVDQFVMNRFSDEISPTSGANFFEKKVMTRDGESMDLQIWDTPGAEKYHNMLKLYYMGCSACLLVYDPNTEEPLDTVEKLSLIHI